MSYLLQKKNNFRFMRSVLTDVMQLVQDLIVADPENESLIALRADIETSIGIIGSEINLIELPTEEDI